MSLHIAGLNIFLGLFFGLGLSIVEIICYKQKGYPREELFKKIGKWILIGVGICIFTSIK